MKHALKSFIPSGCRALVLLAGCMSWHSYVYSSDTHLPHVSPELTLQQNQTVNVTGKIIDASGEPLIGVTISVVNDTRGTITDIDGFFSLTVNTGQKIKISYVGYKEQIHTVKNETNMNITLLEDSETLDEVVIVGYGVQKKVNLTGSVSSVQFDEKMESRPITNVSSALSGMSAGVSVRQSSGKPGEDGASIKIRGVGSLQGSSQPLVIIDGIKGVMDAVNPQDIASISVLKDAAAGAIYGSEAANGVILITTKGGSKDKGKINVRYSGLVSRTKPTNLLNAVTDYADYMELINESATNIGQPINFNQSTIDLWREKSKNPKGLNENGVPNYIAYPNTNWQDAIFSNKVLNEHNVSVDGASEKINFLVSAGFLNNPGIVNKTGIERYSIRTNVEAKVSKWLTVGNRTFGSMQDSQPGNFGSANNFLRQTTPGIYPEWKGKYGYPEAQEESATANNILYFLNNQGGKNKSSRINTTLYTKVYPVKGLRWDFNFNYQKRWDENKGWTIGNEQVKFSDGSIMKTATLPEDMSTWFTNYNNYSYTLENVLNYSTTIKRDHDLGALVGYNEYYYYQESNNATKKGLIDGTITTPGSATEMISIGGGAVDRATRSFFGRVNYAYKSKYLFEANLRYDGHARFHEDHRWGTFPSFSAAWRITEEKFMEGTRSWLDNLKLRGSWGKLGNANSGEYEYMATYNKVNNVLGNKQQSGLAITTLANELITWEKSQTTNIGLDVNVLKNRLSFEFDFFNRKITDLLYRPEIYLTMGNKTPPRKNIAAMRNRGYEITVGWNDQIQDFSYGITANMSYVKNKVLTHKGKLQEGWTTDENGNNIYSSNLGEISEGGIQRILEGHTINEYYLKDVYKGTGNYFHPDGTVNINGGPKDGMIRTEGDMEWLKAMMGSGYKFFPNQSIAKDKIWYGDYIYADANGDGIYGNSYDNQFQGYSNEPKYNYGIQLFGAWKGIDVSMNFAGAAGFKLYWSPTSGYNTTATRVGISIPKDIGYNHYFYDPSNQDDPRTNITSSNPRLTLGENGSQNVSASTRYLHSGNYLKMKNITIGYSLPTKIINKVMLQRVRVYFSGENLFTITNYPGQDPELGANPGYTSVKQIAFGLNVAF